MEQIKSILAGVLRDIQIKQKQYPDDEIDSIWSKCVKKSTAQHSKARSLKKGRLYVNIENTGWLFELNTKKEEILEKLKKVSKNKIKDLKFRIGDIYGK